MVQELGTVELKSKEQMRIVRITTPEPQWCDRLLKLLGHKGQDWLDSMRLALTEGIAPAELRFFVGLLGDELVGNIMTTICSGGRTGILGHVFTPEQHRRKGICTALMRAVTEDFKAGGGWAMALGTGYDSPPYWIYHSFGFRGQQDTGHMIWRVVEDFDARWFAKGPTQLRDTNWDDWAPLELLYSVEDGWLYRSAFFGQVDFGGYEGLYWHWYNAIQSGTVSQHKIMTGPSGAVVGQAYIWRDSRFGRNHSAASVLDFFVHPDFYGDLGRLLGSFTLDDMGKVQAYADGAAEEKIAALQQIGFQIEATFKGQIDHRGRLVDVLVLARS